jgi:Nucleotidyl transferase AbiEii toxin, Type IV TA system
MKPQLRFDPVHVRRGKPVAAVALKGGTALNLFLQEMPRLSVDIGVALPATA